MQSRGESRGERQRRKAEAKGRDERWRREAETRGRDESQKQEQKQEQKQKQKQKPKQKTGRVPCDERRKEREPELLGMRVPL